MSIGTVEKLPQAFPLGTETDASPVPSFDSDGGEAEKPKRRGRPKRSVGADAVAKEKPKRGRKVRKKAARRRVVVEEPAPVSRRPRVARGVRGVRAGPSKSADRATKVLIKQLKKERKALDRRIAMLERTL